MSKLRHITILGGGSAGLATGYYAKKKSLPFTIYEASNHIGGNATTLRHGLFLFDTGAHRFHDKDREITRDLKNLIGEDLKRIEVPSKIYHNKKFIDFPLSPFNLLKKLGLLTFSKSGVELLASRMKNRQKDSNFTNFAVNTYGKTLAEYFLLNYSEKLWGISCDNLSPYISGKRMKGLNLRTFLREALGGNKNKTEHLDGAFYYPKMGFGTIAEKLAGFCGEEAIYKNSRITRIFHDGKRVTAIEINGDRRRKVDNVVSTLPLPVFLALMVPAPERDILSLADDLRFRNLIVVTVFINKDSITGDGSIYFPDPEFPFTRVYEPKNRSRYMSPPGKTSLCAEIPCFPTDKLWNRDEEKLFKCISSYFVKLGWIEEKDVIDFHITRLHFAYPIFLKGFEEKSQRIIDFLRSFSNLKLSGRNGMYLYTHIHDMLKFGKDIVEEYISGYNL